MVKAKIIVIGHGNFASGIRSSLELFVGKQNPDYFIDFTKEMSVNELNRKISVQINDEEIILFTDLLGGSPYKESAKIAYKNNNVGVVTGCNLSSLLETTYKDYKCKEDLMNDLVQISKRTAQVFQRDDVMKETEKKEDFSDGI